jgi:hypothetical protein
MVMSLFESKIFFLENAIVFGRCISNVWNIVLLLVAKMCVLILEYQ